jgi:manganese/zinc/iron transport system permease protein
MLLLSSLFGVLASVAGYYLAVYLDGSIAGAIATMTGLLFGLCLLLSPTHGILFKKLNAVATTDGLPQKV